MLGISKIVSIEEYNATNKLYCDKCESYEWNDIIYFESGNKHLICSLTSLDTELYFVLAPIRNGSFVNR